MSWKLLTFVLIFSVFSPLIVNEHYENVSLIDSHVVYSGFSGTVTVDSIDDVGKYNTIDIDGNGTPHIAYFDDTSNALKYATHDGTNWQISIVQNSTNGVYGQHASMAVDSVGKVHIFYGFHGDSEPNSSGLRYAYGDSNSWAFSNITADHSDSISVDTDSNNEPHITYLSASPTSSSTGSLMYGKLTNNAWNISTVDLGCCNPTYGNSEPYFSSLQIDSNDNPHIAYQKFDNSILPKPGLYYAHHDGNTWSIVTVDSAGSEDGKNPSLTLDSQETPHIVSTAKGRGDTTGRDALMYSTLNGTTWTTAVIYGDATRGSGASVQSPAIEIDTNDCIYISFFDRYNGPGPSSQLLVNYSDAWTVLGGGGGYSSGYGGSPVYLGTAIDQQNDVHISYYDWDTRDLMYYKFESNHAPVITSLEITSEGEIYVGREDPVVFTVEATDDGITDPWQFYVEWTINGNTILCQGANGLVCTTYEGATLTDSPGLHVVRATVYDNYMVSDTREINVIIWNSTTASDDTSSGVEVEYSLKYNSSSPFTIELLDGNINDYANISIPGYRYKYNASAVVEYTPNMEYSMEDVLEQSLRLIIAKPGPASLWHHSSSGNWKFLSDDLQDIDSQTTSFEHDFSPNTSVLPSGNFVLIREVLIPVEDTPESFVTNIRFEHQSGTTNNGLNSKMRLYWDIVGTKLQTDTISIIICLESILCENPVFQQNKQVPDNTYTLDRDHHGIDHYVSIAVCNSADCSTPAINSFISDVKVDPPVHVFNPILHNETPDWADFLIYDSSYSLLSWEHSDDISDVHVWRVCFSDAQINNTWGDEYNIASARDDCVFVDGELNYTLLHLESKGQSYTIHVNIAPYDEFLNGEWFASNVSQQVIYPYAYTCIPGNLRNFTAIVQQFGPHENYGLHISQIESTSIDCGINLFDFLPSNLTREELYEFGLKEWMSDSGDLMYTNLSVTVEIATTWGNFSRIIGHSQFSPNGAVRLGLTPSANVESLTAFEPQWERSGPVELSILISNPSEFTLTPKIQCKNGTSVIPTSYTIPNGMIGPGEEIRFYVYLGITSKGIHDIECNLIPPEELPYMQTNQGFATINYVFNGSQEVENNISNNAMEDEDSQNQKNPQNSQNSQTPILGISVGIFGLIAVIVLFMMKKRNLNDDDDDFDEMNDYDELKNSFNEPNNEPINESISETNQINENDRKPSFDFEGDINEDGWEICEYPRGSNIWWWKDYENESWILWE